TAVPTATIVMKIDGKEIKKASFGDGPVDAALNTIKIITGMQCTLTSYVVKAITGGTDAQGEVSVGVEKDGMRITGRGAHTDIVIASALAFLNALNRLEMRKQGLSLATPLQKTALGGV
ncbi:2-isopropylmalate synthase, partial [Deltaproteobacteria bacterium]|nr:2-isopropylmalate synthase [Deltaproteobacteria bacterium]